MTQKDSLFAGHSGVHTMTVITNKGRIARTAAVVLLFNAVLAFPARSVFGAADDELLAQINNPARQAAPDFDGAEAWINTDKPLKIADLKGKIVLLDFWTFG